MVGDPALFVLFLPEVLDDTFRLDVVRSEFWRSFEMILSREHIFVAVREPIVLLKGKALGLPILHGLSSTFLLSLAVFVVPDGASIMVLLANTDRGDLTGKVFGSKHTEDDGIPQVLRLDQLELYFLGDQLLGVVALPVRVLADRYHCFYKVSVPERRAARIASFIDYFCTKSGWPYVPRGVVLAEALLSGILQAIVDRVCPTDRLDDCSCIG